MERPSWDRYFMDIAKYVSTRSTCLRRQVGAVIVRDKRILTTGYNGVPKGIEHCNIKGCIRSTLNIPSGERVELCRGTHAEQNAILQAALHGIILKGATIYTTTRPCVLCAKMLINCEIERVVFVGDFPDDLALELFREANITIDKLEI